MLFIRAEALQVVGVSHHQLPEADGTLGATAGTGPAWRPSDHRQ
jgi:hypothetical protein